MFKLQANIYQHLWHNLWSAASKFWRSADCIAVALLRNKESVGLVELVGYPTTRELEEFEPPVKKHKWYTTRLVQAVDTDAIAADE
jgi:hypothetical protein